MHIVNISLDPKILDRDTPAAIRVKAYGKIVDSYTVVVPTPSTMTVRLSDNAIVYGVSGANKVAQLWNIYRTLKQLIKDGKCDVIASADMYYLGLVALWLSRRHHVGLEISVLGIEKLSTLRKCIATYVLKNASVVRALSRRLKERLIKEFGVSADHINVISIFVPTDTLGLDARSLDEMDSQHLDKLRQTFKEAHGGYKNFLTVSRLVSIKNISLQLYAVEKLIKQGLPVRLHIVGDGPEEAHLKQLTRNLGLTEHVLFHGRKVGFELGVLYFECDCFVLTSNYEGWGMVIVEAATAGLPVIMTDVGCAGEFLVDGKGGLVIPVGDLEALQKAMYQIATNATLREHCSFGAKEALNTLESFEEILVQYKKNWEFALAHKL